MNQATEQNPQIAQIDADGERLSEIRAEALRETYDCTLDWGHIGLGDFIDWLNLMQPVFALIKGYEDLRKFDTLSIMKLFEEWTQGKHDNELAAAISQNLRQSAQSADPTSAPSAETPS